MPIFNYLLLLYDFYRDNDLLLQEIFLFGHNPNIDNPSESCFTPSAFSITVLIYAFNIFHYYFPVLVGV